LNLPLEENSTVVPTASPMARPSKQARARSENSTSVDFDRVFSIVFNCGNAKAQVTKHG
jgi:hypothetical protein